MKVKKSYFLILNLNLDFYIIYLILVFFFLGLINVIDLK
jgi:hypothetical protein